MKAIKYENMKLVSIYQLKILDNKPNYDKALAELYEQNSLDFYLLLEKLPQCKAEIVDVASGYVAEIEDAIDSIIYFWKYFFEFLWRFHMRRSFLALGVERGKYSDNEINDFRTIYDARLLSCFGLVFSLAETHFVRLNPSDMHSSKKRKFLSEIYGGLISKSIGEISEEIPAREYIKIYGIEKNLEDAIDSALIDA